MSGSDTLAYRYKQWLLEQPGKRGIDIPEHVYDRIYPVANGITQPMWGRPPTPWQMQHLHDQKAHTPERIHQAFADLPHPHAPSLSVGQYEAWKAAYSVYKEHS